MILHFSHIGLTDGLTFIDPFRLVPAIRLWLPPRPPLPVVEAPTAHKNVRNEQDR